MYPVYALEVFDYVQDKWVPVAHMEASNRPHHYDKLRTEFDRLVRGAKNGSPSQMPIGYRITSNGHPVDEWGNWEDIRRVVYWRRLPGFSAKVFSLEHDCPVVSVVEVSQDWRFCPWCGCGLVRAIARAKEDNPDAARLSEGETDWADI